MSKNSEIKEKKERILKEKERLMLALSNLNDDLVEANMSLIENLAFTVVMLEDLREHVLLYGVSEEYQNGENQKGRKDSVEMKQFNLLSKNYIALIRTLNQLLPKDEKLKETDELDKFLNG